MMEKWPQLPSIHKAQRTRSGLYHQRNTGGGGESRMEGKITATWLPSEFPLHAVWPQTNPAMYC